MKTYITRGTFDAVFEDCMNSRTIQFPDGTEEETTPRMCIRNQDTGSEHEFVCGQLEDAWSYFENNYSKSRVMNVAGTIYFDTF